MKIIQMKGGLGNQMFQYSFFLVNKKFNDKVKLDITSYNNYYLHNGIELFKVFGIVEDDIIEDESIFDFKDNYIFFKFRKVVGLFFLNKNLFIKKTHFIEKSYSQFYENLLAESNLFLDGYWQNEKYFINHRKLILKIYNWHSISEKNRKLISEMEKVNSVSLHIRRYDRIKNIKDLFYLIKLILTYRTASKSYYLDAIKFIKDNVNQPKFYIFTDNIEWVKKNIPTDDNYVIVNWNRGSDSNQDMCLMTKCKHNIISMSTFSWWGAWLNENKNKIVISPKKWAVRLEKDYGIIPESWVRM